MSSFQKCIAKVKQTTIAQFAIWLDDRLTIALYHVKQGHTRHEIGTKFRKFLVAVAQHLQAEKLPLIVAKLVQCDRIFSEV